MTSRSRDSLRKDRLLLRDRLDPVLRREKSREIMDLLTGHALVGDAGHLLVYISFRSEVETMPLVRRLLAAGKTVSVPLTLFKPSRLLAVQLTDPATQLAPGCYGIPEPTPEQVRTAVVDPASIDTVLVPGSVFDRTGGRLGYGGGFYDRFLVESAPQAMRVALAFELQLTDRVPMEAHDQYMDFLVTEKRIDDCRRNRRDNA